MVKNRYLIDTNVFIAFYIDSDSSHEKALALSDLITNEEIIIPYCIIQETCTLLAYKFGKNRANDFLFDIKSSSNMTIINHEFESEIEIFKSINQKISFIDTSLIYLSKKYNAELLSFDKQLINLYKKFN